MNLHIVALFRFKENHLFEALELLKKLVVETRKEQGCLQYDLVEDRENIGTFFIVELWENEDYHHLHSVTDHLLKFRQNALPLMVSQTEVYKGMKVF